MTAQHRFPIVAGLCALLHNLVMIGGDLAELHYLVSSLWSYLLVGAVGYALHAAYTFREPRRVSSFFRYAAAMAANYPLSVALMFVLCDLFGLPVVIAAPLATVAMVIWNFASSRWAIVRRPVCPEP